MIDTNPTDPGGADRKGAREFFYSFLGADYLQDMQSVEEAVNEYLGCEGNDPDGKLLLSEIEELINANMSEEELANLIEKTWQADAVGFIYQDVLTEARDLLRQHTAK